MRMPLRLEFMSRVTTSEEQKKLLLLAKSMKHKLQAQRAKSF
jgi:hypothetical protein